jgi:hypothetical protein
MNSIILFWYLLCSTGTCETVPFEVSREAGAIISCESGDGHHYGTYSLYARSETEDGGLFQFNDQTYLWMTGRDHAQRDAPEVQYAAFRELWRDGRGWRHWKASQACWSQWMSIQDNTAVWIEE